MKIERITTLLFIDSYRLLYWKSYVKSAFYVNNYNISDIENINIYKRKRNTYIIY